MKPYLRLLILTALICCLSVEAHPASSTQSYLFKNSVLKSQPTQYAPFLLAQQSQDSISVKNMRSLKLKSPYMAIFFSVIPGVVFHGSGHVYAGRIPTGIMLFGSEILGGYLMFLGALTGLESGQTSDNGDYGIMIGSFLFFGSWIYDVINSPIVVKKQNQEILKRKNTELRLQPKDAGLRLVFVYHF
jgi:hypothetical protein